MAKVVPGPALIQVGERSANDKKFATDEYIYAMPGTIVAPRPHGEEPTPQNAAKAILKKGRELGIFGSETKPEHLMGGNMPPAYTAYKNMAAAVGPKNFNRVPRAQTGAAVNPTGDALTAIQSVADMLGVDIPTAVGMLSGVPQPTQDLGATYPYAEGGDAMSQFMQLLLGAAGITGPDLTLAQLAVMNSLGTVNPMAIGVTDPVEFRNLLMSGQGMPTLDARKQKFNESLFGFSQSSPNRGNVPQIAS